MASTEKITNVLNTINQGLNTASQATGLVTNIVAAKNAAKNGTVSTNSQTSTASTSNTTSAASSSTNLILGFDKKTVMIGGACIAGALLLVLLLKR